MSVVERALEKLRRGHPKSEAIRRSEPTQETIGSLVEAQPVSDTDTRIVIDREALRAAGYLPEENQDRQFADEYRQIKRPIVAAAFSAEGANQKPSPRLVMMASALPGDGKTFTSINLALSLARERDYSVVLVDADVAKPHISRIFGVESESGLLDALSDPGADVNLFVLPTDVRGLSILPAGIVRDGATELLSSARMPEISAQILARHPRCVVLFDSPPLVVSSESRALAGAMGQIVLVVRAGRTPRQALEDALEAVQGCPSVRLVLNQGRRSLLDGVYGYSYGTYGDTGNG
jgi:protein-tyrosine kinase